MLFVIQKKSFKYQMIPIRLLLIIRLFFNIPKELFDDLEDGNRIKCLACNLFKTKIQISEKIN